MVTQIRTYVVTVGTGNNRMNGVARKNADLNINKTFYAEYVGTQ